MLTDSLERELALSCDRSFIVQAPAGSGKTELLSRRFLKLLTTVENPEQIVALTFTKKAAFEMRTRIIEALQKNPLEVDRRNQWHLIENPHRLRIYTIDSFCSQLAKNLPVTAGMGGMPDIEDNPQYLYQKAIENYLSSIENEGEGSQGLSLILQHFHNRYEVIEKLFLSMLTRRDQWLHLVMSARRDPVKIKKVIQNSILSIHQEAYTHLNKLLSDDLKIQWLNLASFAASQLSLENKPHAILSCLNIIDFPDNTYDNQERFSGLYELLFTASGTLRKRVDKNIGFPPTSPEMKKLYFEFISQLEKNESLIEQIKILPSLPAIDLDLDEWTLLEALWEGLPILVAHLQLMFKQYNKVDFTEVNLKALEALGEEDNPTDLALILDYQIQHLLVDEFQDTSSIQYQLFEKIVSGWQPDDGRTIFVVGDPMQSIYRFRGAEVGLYLKLQQQGFGGVQPTNIVLSSNFRSDKNIVDWVNASFSGIFSKENDMVLSKISYSPSCAINTYPGSGVYSYQSDSDLHESQYIISKIQEIKISDPEGSIAILVRARHHAQAIFHALLKEGIAYQAIDMMSLKNSQLITDLLTLTRMIEQLDNKLAWYSILRSPVCGLSLADLLALSVSNQELGFLKNIILDHLSTDGQIRAKKILTILSYWQENQYRLPLHQSIRHLWVSLGYDQYYQDKVNADSYFELLKTWEEGNQFGDFNALEKKLESLFQVSHGHGSISSSIQIMTIHKSKGLEFDYVFVPGLHHTTIKEDQPLVIYHEIPYDTHVDWLIAPKYTNNKPSMLYDYIYSQLQQKATYETQRVLYVAATRAKKQLIWSYVKENEKENPSKDSFLAMLAPYLNTVVVSQHKKCVEKNIETDTDTNIDILETQYSPIHTRILSQGLLPWRNVELQFISKSDSAQDNPLNRPVVQVYEKLAIIGSYLHRLFASWPTINKINSRAHRNNLLAMGLYLSDLDYGLELILKIIQQCQQDIKFKWIMDCNHDCIKNEFALNFVRNNKLQTRILDKFFIDKSNLSAWIIDFKLSLDQPNPNDHLAQLKEYAKLINELGVLSDKRLYFGLYYPYQSYWWEQESICA